MTTFALPSTQRLAYLTVSELSTGLVGGLLTIDLRGRPIEFHCTTPLAVSRAEQLLHGDTLAAYLYADCLGAALIAKVKQAPDLVLVNQMPSYDLSTQCPWPVALIASEANPSAFVVGTTPVVCAAADVTRIESLLQRLGEVLDISEPFARIIEAIRETHQVLAEEASHVAAA